jgi:hypothetical protein
MLMMMSDWAPVRAPVIQSSLQLAFNSIPLGVGINILSRKETQDKSQMDLMELNIKSESYTSSRINPKRHFNPERTPCNPLKSFNK